MRGCSGDFNRSAAPERPESVDHDLRLKADHSPRLDRWTARLSSTKSHAEGPPKSMIQREQFVIY